MVTSQGTFPLGRTPPPSVGVKETGPSTVQPVATNPATQQIAKGSEGSQALDKWWSEEGHDRLKHFLQGKNDSAEREKALELERVIKELDLVKKELEEERELRKEDKELLAVERQKREEVEHALADVRRECRQPFVVPSLLDAFVELSKVATRGVKVSGKTVLVNPSSGYPPPQEATASHNEGRTKVKFEPLDNTTL
jgi:hypothetical protein